ncbi:MAG: 16S rRNA methyltransferase [delta proteobacterium ML8_F1]|nr:MAG: 16S rRNA methyltransferase [delta proteobacterium ML8_F1]
MTKGSLATRIKEITLAHNFRMSKALGQNFLKDPHILESIIDSAELTEGDTVIEVGPGIGVLTEAIAQRAKQVIGIEIDRHLIPILEQTLRDYPGVRIIHEDVLKVNLAAIEKQFFPGAEPKIIANLPYYITTPIIMHFLESSMRFKSMTVMMQKEVADRIISEPGLKTYGTISVAVQYYTRVEKVTEVPRGAFIPEPKVDSTVIKLTPHSVPPVILESHVHFFRTVKAAFSTRRKTLVNALSNAFDKEQVKEAVKTSGIDPSRRGETLTIEEFARLSNELYRIEKSS